MTDIALHVEQQRSTELLGASEAAAALGLDPYTPPITIWRRHRGLASNDERPAFVQEAAEWGQALEPVVRGKYALLRKALVVVPEVSREMDGWLRATPDGLVYTRIPSRAGLTITESECGLDSDPDGMYQGKTCSAYKRDEWIDSVPPAYEVQVRVEMAVLDLPWSDVCCLIGGQKFAGPFRIERDAALEDRILTDLRAFWRMVKDGHEPNPDHTAAWRAHITERMPPSKIAIVPDSGQSATILRWKAARNELAAAKRAEAEHKNRLLLELAAAGATAFDLGPEGKLTAYRTGAKPSWKDYAISLGGSNTVPDRFKGKPGSFTLRAPWSDDDGE